VLFSERKRRRALQEREAAGESFWTSDFTDEVRTKVKWVLWDCAGDYSARDIVEYAHGLVCRDLGREWLTAPGTDSTQDLLRALAVSETEMVATVVESLYQGMKRIWPTRANTMSGSHADFEERVNDVLSSHRVSFELIDGQMIEKESQELHSNVVAPVLRLLSGRKGWDRIEAAYQDALREVSQNNPDDAITDAGRALEDALTTLGCSGNSLGPKITDAVKRGLIASHDAPVLHWVSADRSQRGDAHPGPNPTRDDAWLTIHVVGALILRLASSN
jgi:hypothetical protein